MADHVTTVSYTHLDVYKRQLAQYGISTKGKYARQVTKQDYEDYDYIICMEKYNLREIKRILPADPEGKICCLLDFSDHPRDIADPWYTGNFDVTYDDILEGCEGLLTHLEKEL